MYPRSDSPKRENNREIFTPLEEIREEDDFKIP
jgi:hypothetical protein